MGNPMKIIFAVCLALVLQTAKAMAQSVTNSFWIQSDQTNVELNYSLADTNGAFFLLQSDQLTNMIGDGQEIFAGIAASNPVGAISVPLPTNSAAYWTLMQDPTIIATASDLVPNLDGEESPVDLSEIFIQSTNLPAELTANTPIPLTLNVYDINGNVLSTNGQISLSLGLADGTAVDFSYSLLPAVVTVTNGTAQTTLTIQTTNNLIGVFLYCGFTWQSAGGPSKLSSAPVMPIGQANVLYTSYADPDTVNWLYPLSGSFPFVGGFGEYPGHKDIHWGIDLAAPLGTCVLAAKQGIVVHVGKDLGKDCTSLQNQIVEIYHGNGYVTRYMHINPLAWPGKIVNKGDVVGTVGQFCVKVHLHFEMNQLNDPSFYNQNYNYMKLYSGVLSLEGKGKISPINPINPAFTFSQDLFSSGGYIPSLLLPALYFRCSHPALINTPLPMQPSNPSQEPVSSIVKPSEVYIVLQAVLQNFGSVLAPDNPVLTPTNITFTSDVGPAQQIVYGTTQASIKQLDPRGKSASQLAGPGYTLLTTPETSLKSADIPKYRSLRYKYWFQWDTSQYAPLVGPPSLGPHGFTVQAQDLAGHSVSSNFTFGPSIQPITRPFAASPSGSVLTVPINYRFGPLPNVGMSSLNALDICQCSVSVTPASDWTVLIQPALGQTAQGSNGLDFNVFGDMQTSKVKLLVTPNNANVTNGTLTLGASSWVFPGIQDQANVELIQQPIDCSGISVSGSVSLTAYNIDANDDSETKTADWTVTQTSPEVGGSLTCSSVTTAGTLTYSVQLQSSHGQCQVVTTASFSAAGGGIINFPWGGMALLNLAVALESVGITELFPHLALHPPKLNNAIMRASLQTAPLTTQRMTLALLSKQ
jgi:Peptidase family M23